MKKVVVLLSLVGLVKSSMVISNQGRVDITNHFQNCTVFVFLTHQSERDELIKQNMQASIERQQNSDQEDQGGKDSSRMKRGGKKGRGVVTQKEDERLQFNIVQQQQDVQKSQGVVAEVAGDDKRLERSTNSSSFSERRRDLTPPPRLDSLKNLGGTMGNDGDPSVPQAPRKDSAHALPTFQSISMDGEVVSQRDQSKSAQSLSDRRGTISPTLDIPEQLGGSMGHPHGTSPAPKYGDKFEPGSQGK